MAYINHDFQPNTLPIYIDYEAKITSKISFDYPLGEQISIDDSQYVRLYDRMKERFGSDSLPLLSSKGRKIIFILGGVLVFILLMAFVAIPIVKNATGGFEYKLTAYMKAFLLVIVPVAGVCVAYGFMKNKDDLKKAVNGGNFEVWNFKITQKNIFRMKNASDLHFIILGNVSVKVDRDFYNRAIIGQNVKCIFLTSDTERFFILGGEWCDDIFARVSSDNSFSENRYF